jgi:GDP-4-dehydro-6-deoxy-D-mannose reductase
VMPRSMPGPILVTGAAGFVGGHMLELLARDNAELVAWHRPGAAPPVDLPAATWEPVDLLDRTGVREAIARVRPATVYHCAGAALVGRSWASVEPTFAVNVWGTHHLIEGFRETGVEARVLIPGSAMVYAPSGERIREDHSTVPSNPYGLSKLAQELVGCGNPAGPEVFIARAFNHLGARQDPEFVASGFARRIADIEAGRCPPEIDVGNLDARRDLTDVRDTVRAYRLIVERGKPGRAYNVCTGRAVSIRGLLDMLLALAQVPIRIKVDPARYRPSDLPILVGDPGRIQQEIGWTADIPLERTLEDLLAFWRRTT